MQTLQNFYITQKSTLSLYYFQNLSYYFFFKKFNKNCFFFSLRVQKQYKQRYLYQKYWGHFVNINKIFYKNKPDILWWWWGELDSEEIMYAIVAQGHNHHVDHDEFTEYPPYMINFFLSNERMEAEEDPFTHDNLFYDLEFTIDPENVFSFHEWQEQWAYDNEFDDLPDLIDCLWGPSSFIYSWPGFRAIHRGIWKIWTVFFIIIYDFRRPYGVYDLVDYWMELMVWVEFSYSLLKRSFWFIIKFDMRNNYFLKHLKFNNLVILKSKYLLYYRIIFKFYFYCFKFNKFSNRCYYLCINGLKKLKNFFFFFKPFFNFFFYWQGFRSIMTFIFSFFFLIILSGGLIWYILIYDFYFFQILEYVTILYIIIFFFEFFLNKKWYQFLFLGFCFIIILFEISLPFSDIVFDFYDLIRFYYILFLDAYSKYPTTYLELFWYMDSLSGWFLDIDMFSRLQRNR